MNDIPAPSMEKDLSGLNFDLDPELLTILENYDTVTVPIISLQQRNSFYYSEEQHSAPTPEGGKTAAAWRCDNMGKPTLTAELSCTCSWSGRRVSYADVDNYFEQAKMYDLPCPGRRKAPQCPVIRCSFGPLRSTIRLLPNREDSGDQRQFWRVFTENGCTPTRERGGIERAGEKVFGVSFNETTHTVHVACRNPRPSYRPRKATTCTFELIFYESGAHHPLQPPPRLATPSIVFIKKAWCAMAMLSEDEFFLDDSSVLAFLNDFEMGNDLNLVSTSDSASSSTGSPAPAEKKKSWRQRRKDEVLNLREVVKQLSVELEKLKMAAGVHSTLPASKANCTATTPKFVLKAHQTEAALMWAKIAARQSSLRQSSEEENAKLRQAVTRHLQQAKSLQRAIKRKLREDLMTSSVDLVRQHRLNTRGVAPPLNNTVVFDQLLDGLDAVYQGVDGFFQQAGMHHLQCPGRRSNKPNRNFTKGLFVEFLDNYAVPFSVRDTAKVIWTPEEQRREESLHFLQEFTVGKDTRMRSMSFAFSLNGLDFHVTMRSVMRKYTEQARTVFITRTLIESFYEGLSVSLVETNRMVLKRGDLSAVGPTTVMQTHRASMLHEDLSGLDLTRYPSLNFGLAKWESNITRYNNCVEDQLVRAMH